MQAERDAAGKCRGDRLRPAASCRFSQPYERFDVKCLREQVEEVHLRDFVTDARPGNFFRFAGRVR